MILKAINGVIANKIRELLTDMDSAVGESELLQDAKTLKLFIKTIEPIGNFLPDEQHIESNQTTTDETRVSKSLCKPLN